MNAGLHENTHPSKSPIKSFPAQVRSGSDRRVQHINESFDFNSFVDTKSLGTRRLVLKTSAEMQAVSDVFAKARDNMACFRGQTRATDSISILHKSNRHY